VPVPVPVPVVCGGWRTRTRPRPAACPPPRRPAGASPAGSRARTGPRSTPAAPGQRVRAGRLSAGRRSVRAREHQARLSHCCQFRSPRTGQTVGVDQNTWRPPRQPNPRPNRGWPLRRGPHRDQPAAVKAAERLVVTEQDCAQPPLRSSGMRPEAPLSSRSPHLPPSRSAAVGDGNCPWPSSEGRAKIR